MSRRPLSFSRLLDLPENHSALLAVRSLADSLALDRKLFANLIYLHGPHGTGKTSFVKALAAEVLRQNSRAIVSNLPAAEIGAFLNCSSGDPEVSEKSIQDIDLLVIEDIQHLPSRLEDAFANLIDDLSALQTTLVCTASVGPQNLPFVGRLTSRLASGLVVALESWKADSRLRFLQTGCQERQLAVRQEVLAFLAHQIRGSSRELEGALNRLQALNGMQEPPLSVADVAGHFQEELEASRPTVNRIVARVSDYFHVPTADLVSARRTRAVLLPRQVSMYLSRQMTNLSLHEIGACFGGRDHTTVLHACRKVAETLARDNLLAGTVRQLQAALT
jgi:chromosomal replication initiator protein